MNHHSSFVLSISARLSRLSLLVALCTVLCSSLAAQDNQKTNKDELAVVRGKIAYDRQRSESWDGSKLVVPFEEIKAMLRERVILPMPPLPENFAELKPEQQLEWEKQFVESAEGKKFLEDRAALLEKASAFDVLFEKDGSFVIYDVPAGIYGIQGRVDKEIDGRMYAFEVFGQIEIAEDVDEVPLKPMAVEITPLLKSKQPAPPVAVKIHDDSQVLTLEAFKGNLVFVNFWTAQSPTAAAEQKMVQDMYEALQSKYDLKLLSINIDENRKETLSYIGKNGLTKGSHGFTGGLDHPTIFHYGVRSYPSFWLIDKEGQIMMSQYEVAQAMRLKPDMTTIVTDRIEGRDVPTPAKPEGGGDEQQKSPEQDK